MDIGLHLVEALVAGAAYWLVGVLLGGRAPTWVIKILEGTVLVYVFWLLVTYGPLQIGR